MAPASSLHETCWPKDPIDAKLSRASMLLAWSVMIRCRQDSCRAVGLACWTSSRLVGLSILQPRTSGRAQSRSHEDILLLMSRRVELVSAAICERRLQSLDRSLVHRLCIGASTPAVMFSGDCSHLLGLCRCCSLPLGVWRCCVSCRLFDCAQLSPTGVVIACFRTSRCENPVEIYCTGAGISPPGCSIWRDWSRAWRWPRCAETSRRSRQSLIVGLYC